MRTSSAISVTHAIALYVEHSRKAWLFLPSHVHYAHMTYVIHHFRRSARSRLMFRKSEFFRRRCVEDGKTCPTSCSPSDGRPPLRLTRHGEISTAILLQILRWSWVWPAVIRCRAMGISIQYGRLGDLWSLTLRKAFLVLYEARPWVRLTGRMNASTRKS